MNDVYLCDAVRTPFGRYAGALAAMRADDLGAVPIRALIERHPGLDWSRLDEVFYGCANQAGEDNRNVARMSALLAGLPESVPGTTINRLCASGLDAIGSAARAIASGELGFAIAGGVESMSRAPYVMGKADSAYARSQRIEDTTIGWRFVNPLMRERYGVDSMPQTADNVATDYDIARADQDAFALRSQQRAAAAQAAGYHAEEIVPVTIRDRRGDTVIATDEHPRPDTTLASLAKLRGVNGAMNRNAVGLHTRNELVQVFVEVLNHPGPNGVRTLATLGPIGDGGQGSRAALKPPLHVAVEGDLQVIVLKRSTDVLFESVHGRLFKISAMCRTTCVFFWRCKPPAMCMRQPLSATTSVGTFWAASRLAILRLRNSAASSGCSTEKTPPNPQHSSR